MIKIFLQCFVSASWAELYFILKVRELESEVIYKIHDIVKGFSPHFS